MSGDWKGSVGVVDPKCTYKWVIPNFRETDQMKLGDKLISPVFTIQVGMTSYKWKLNLYPQGHIRSARGHLSIYLISYNDCTIDISFSICIVNNQKHDFNKSIIQNRRFESKYSDFGLSQFIERDTIMRHAIDNGELTIKCEISVISSSKAPIFKLHKISQTDDAVQMLESTSKAKDSFRNFFDNQNFSDVKFIIGNKSMHAHKIILSIRSPVFAAMFEHDTEENKKNEVIITDVTYEVFKNLLQYIYCGEVNGIEVELAMELMFAADKYQLDDLKSAMEVRLIEGMCVENTLEIYSLADFHGAKKLKMKAKEFLIEHAREIVKRPDFKTIANLHPDVMAEIVQALVLKE